MKNLKRLFCLAIVLIIISAQVSAIEDIGEKNNPANEMKIRMVLFTPADKSLPEEYKERYKQVADYAESFFSKSNFLSSRFSRTLVCPTQDIFHLREFRHNHVYIKNPLQNYLNIDVNDDNLILAADSIVS